MAFIGLPCPKNAAGMRSSGPLPVPASTLVALLQRDLSSTSV
jgi:hypothetical protein